MIQRLNFKRKLILEGDLLEIINPQHLIVMQSLMPQKDDSALRLQDLTLQQIFQLPDLTLQQMFLIKDINHRIKSQAKMFVDYCKNKQLFTDKLINLGIKSPMHQSNNAQMKIISYVSSDILTCDHESLADLFILKLKHTANKQDQMDASDQIPEEIQIQEIEQPSVLYTNKYIFLLNILDYINTEILNENCLNYLSKALQTLVRKKSGQFLQFFHQYPKVLNRMIQICHFPSISHLLDRLITEYDDNSSSVALQQKSKIIPLLLQKVHNEIDDIRTYDILESIDEILQSSRSGEVDQRTLLQKLSDRLVSEQQIVFHVDVIKSSLKSVSKSIKLLYSLNNSIAYLTIVVTRMQMDEQKDYNNQQKQYKPRLLYQLDSLFLSFNSLLNLYDHIRQFQQVQLSLAKSIPLKFIEMCLRMSKHSQFQQFYHRIDIEQRASSLKMLMNVITIKQVKGVLLQNISCILENILSSQERAAYRNNKFITPCYLFSILKQKQIRMSQILKNLSQQSIRQRNKNQKGIFLRKFFITIDNYLRNQNLQNGQSQKLNLSKIFPQFNTQNCKKYAQTATLSNYLQGRQIKQVQQFKFIHKNINILNQQTIVLPQIAKSPEPQINNNENIPEYPRLKLRDNVILGRLDKNFRKKTPDIKADVEQSQVYDNKQQSQICDNKPGDVERIVRNQLKPESVKVSPKLSKGTQQGLQFFIRHLNVF